MDIKEKNIELRIVAVGIIFTILLCIIIGRVVYIQINWKKNISYANRQLLVKKNELIEEGNRLENVINNLESLTLIEIQTEVKKTKKYLEDLQETTEKELKSLNKLRLLAQNKQNQIEELEEQRTLIKNLNEMDIEVLTSILANRKNEALRHISAFVIGILTSLAGSYLFRYRKKIINDIHETYKFVLKTIKDNIVERNNSD